jgi:Toprim domain
LQRHALARAFGEGRAIGLDQRKNHGARIVRSRPTCARAASTTATSVPRDQPNLVHTAQVASDRKTMVPDPRGTVLGFPFVDHGEIVNTKYRDIKTKRFWQTKGGTATFYGADIMDDPAFSGDQPLTIVEGELDKLAVETAGNPFVVSVPEGAPPPSKDHKPEERSGSDEAGKFKFMWNNRDRLKRIRRFVLAVDDDAPGKRLADELIRRLLASRCLMVKYPEGCKKSPGGAATVYGADIMDDPAFDGDQPNLVHTAQVASDRSPVPPYPS